jgi:hypothetical protein
VEKDGNDLVRGGKPHPGNAGVSSIEQQTAKTTKSRYAQSNAIELGWLVGTGPSMLRINTIACATEQREGLHWAAKFQR